jgi:Outer membrane protein beta-barrel domain
MKRLIFLTLFLTALAGTAQIRTRIFAGYNSTAFAVSKTAGYYSVGPYSSISAFQAGAGLEIALGKRLYLEPDLVYFANGSNFSTMAITPGGAYGDIGTLRAYNLRLPLNLIYRYQFRNGFSVFGSAGLYGSRTLSAREKGTRYFALDYSPPKPIDQSDMLANTSDNSTGFPLKYYDFGYVLQFGMEWKQVQLAAGWTHGLVNINANSQFPVHSKSFALTLGYFLGSLKK